MMLTMTLMMKSRMTVNLMKTMNMQVRMMRRITMRTLRMRMSGNLLSTWQFQNQPTQRWMNPILGTQTRYTMTNI